MNTIKCLSGWLSPIGEFFECDFMGHFDKAIQIIRIKRIEKDYENRGNKLFQEDEFIWQLGYIKFTFDGFVNRGLILFPSKFFDGENRITKEQLRWCEENFEKFDSTQKLMYYERLKA